MANPLVGRCEALAAAGRHITAVTVTQRGETEYEVRITLQDWATGDELLAGEGGVITMCTRERLPDVVWTMTSTMEMVEDWIAELARVGEAIDWARFDRPGYRRWLTKPNKWSKFR